RECFRERFEGDPTKSRIYKDVSNGVAPAGIEAYLPLFFEKTATLDEYVPAQATWVVHGDVAASAEAFWKDLRTRHQLLRGERDRPLLEPRELYVPVEDFFVALGEKPRIDMRPGDPSQGLPAIDVDRRALEPLERLKAFVDGFEGRALIVAEGAGRRETLSQFFAEHHFHPALVDDWQRFLESAHPLAMTYGPVTAGFLLAGERIAVVTEAELYPGQVRQTRRRDGR